MPLDDPSSRNRNPAPSGFGGSPSYGMPLDMGSRNPSSLMQTPTSALGGAQNWTSPILNQDPRRPILTGDLAAPYMQAPPVQTSGYGAGDLMGDLYGIRSAEIEAQRGRLQDQHTADRVAARAELQRDKKYGWEQSARDLAMNDLDKRIAAAQASVARGNLADIPKLRALAAERLALAQRGFDEETKTAKTARNRGIRQNISDSIGRGAFFMPGKDIRESDIRKDFRQNLRNIGLGREEAQLSFRERMQALDTQERGARSSLAVNNMAMQRYGLNADQILAEAKKLGSDLTRRTGLTLQELEKMLQADIGQLDAADNELRWQILDEVTTLIDQGMDPEQIFGSYVNSVTPGTHQGRYGRWG